MQLLSNWYPFSSLADSTEESINLPKGRKRDGVPLSHLPPPPAGPWSTHFLLRWWPGRCRSQSPRGGRQWWSAVRSWRRSNDPTVMVAGQGTTASKHTMKTAEQLMHLRLRLHCVLHDIMHCVHVMSYRIVDLLHSWVWFPNFSSPPTLGVSWCHSSYPHSDLCLCSCWHNLLLEVRDQWCVTDAKMQCAKMVYSSSPK